MKGLLSNLCMGSIAGVTAAVIMVSIFAMLLFDLDYTAKELLAFYGIAILVGVAIGTIAGWLQHCRKPSKQDSESDNSVLPH